MKLVLSDEAKDDIADYWSFVYKNANQYGKDSQIAADSAIDTFFARVRNLETFPELGRLREEFGKGIRCLPIQGYLVFYKIRSEDIVLARVIHGRRDLETVWEEK
jgi:toxin ParE1/3/4